MLALTLNVPATEQDWQRWSFSNKDAVAQIREAIRVQKGVTLPDYKLDPINFSDPSNFLASNQQAHTDFASVLNIQTSDLLEVDLRDRNQLQAWINLNYFELSSACEILRIGP